MDRVAIGLIVGAMLVGVGGAAAQGLGGNATARKMKNPVQSTPSSVAAGKALYTKHCASCHGATGKGDGRFASKNSPPADLSDGDWKRGSSDGEIFAVVREGAAPELVMKGFKGRMTDQEIWNVVNYVRSFASKGSQ